MNIKRPESKQPLPENATRVFKGVMFDTYQWEQELFDGTKATFEKLKRPDTVVVFPILPDGKILLTQQEQPGKQPFIGATGGRVDEGEDTVAAAKRELLEESGYEAEEFILWDAQHPTSKIDWVVYTFIAKGLKKVADVFGVSLIGGDSVKTKDKLCFSLTIFGETAKGKSLKRSGAKAGDLIFVSGNIGDAFLGLQLLQEKIICQNKNIYKNIDKNNYKYLISRHLHPTPRIKLGMDLIKQNCKSAIDISDGFLADLKHICEASKLDAIVNQDLIPISKAAKFCLTQNKDIALIQLFSGGDDYELIFTVAKKDRQKIINLGEKLGVKITQVGYLQKPKNKPKIFLKDQNNQEIKISQFGWQHY